MKWSLRSVDWDTNEFGQGHWFCDLSLRQLLRDLWIGLRDWSWFPFLGSLIERLMSLVGKDAFSPLGCGPRDYSLGDWYRDRDSSLGSWIERPCLWLGRWTLCLIEKPLLMVGDLGLMKILIDGICLMLCIFPYAETCTSDLSLGSCWETYRLVGEIDLERERDLYIWSLPWAVAERPMDWSGRSILRENEKFLLG